MSISLFAVDPEMLTQVIAFAIDFLYATKSLIEPAYLVAGIVIFAIIPPAHPRYQWWARAYKKSFVIYAAVKLFLWIIELFS